MILTEDQIVDELFKELGEKDLHFIFNMNKDDLISLHHSYGRHIRNTYKLWENKWNPVLQDQVDVSEGHPDAISMRIIEKLWKKLQVVKELMIDKRT